MSDAEDSDSRAEERMHGSDAENRSPQSPASSEHSSSPQSPASAPQSPRSGPESPSSPPQSPLSAPESPASAPQSPGSAPESPSSPHSRSSPPQSPASGQQVPSSPPQSPQSGNEHSDEEVQVSSPEASDNEEQMDTSSNKNAEPENEDMEKDEDNENASSDREDKEENEAEESGAEENIPEINIESADEDERSEKQNDSDNEQAQAADSDEEKDDKESNKVASDDENKSDDEMPTNEQVNKSSSSPSNSPERSSPVPDRSKDQQSDDDDDDDDINKPSKSKADSDAEQNAESDSDADSDVSEVGGLIADIFGDSDDEGEFEGFGGDEEIGSSKAAKESVKPKKEKKKRAQIMSDSEDEDEKAEGKEKDSEDTELPAETIEDVPIPQQDAGDEEDDEIIDKEGPPLKKKAVESDDSDVDVDRKMREDFVSDFELMMQKKKQENSKRRKRRDVDLISDSDDLIADIIAQMRHAAEEDKELNKQKRTATKKLKILSMVMSQLKKQDLKMAFLDQGVLNVIAEWLTPLPDRSLPHLNIREGMLKQLMDFPAFDQGLLKSSGIGRALMYLYKHPKETKENRERAGRLITEWARPIFNVTTDYHSLTKEEREQRDYDHVPKRRKLRDPDAEELQEPKKDIEKELSGEQKSLRPGDKGWIGRARVPMPSTKDYVNRPKWNVETEFGRGPSKKSLTRIERHMRNLQEKKKMGKVQRAITISIEGRKMAI